VSGMVRVNLQPSQVTNNANGKLIQIERIAGDYAMPTPQRMAMITALCDEFRAGVAGSTADPFCAGRGVNG